MKHSNKLYLDKSTLNPNNSRQKQAIFLCYLFYTSNIARRITEIIMMIEYKFIDRRINFSFRQFKNNNTGKMNVNTIIGSQSISKIAPTKGKW